MYFFLNVYMCDLFFTLYSKQINNYNLSFTWIFACECVCGCFHWHFCCFLFVSVFLKHGHLPVPTEPEASKNWFSTSVCVWSVLVLFQHNHFVGKLVPFNCSCRTTFFLFLLVSSFSNKDWTFKTTTLCFCIVCFFFFQ